MITLKLAGWMSGAHGTLGPAPWFRIAGDHIRKGPDDEAVAFFRNHQWQVKSTLYARIDCDGPVSIHFEDANGERSETFGPYRILVIADGVMRADDEFFAKFTEETRLWGCYPTDSYWPVITIKAGL